MPIPDFQSLMLPLLALAEDGQEHSLEEARGALARQFGLTPEERNELLPSGRQRRFDNRVAWAKSFLDEARLLDTPRRAHFCITERGKQLLGENPKRIDIPLLKRYEEFKQFRAAQPGAIEAQALERPEAEPQSATLEEVLEQAYQGIRATLAAEVLARVKGGSPQFFERLVVELLLKMGYGGDRAEAGKALGGVGDEGIDGTISEDRLGLDMIYIQAKRWEGTVGRPEIQKFVGGPARQAGAKGRAHHDRQLFARCP